VERCSRTIVLFRPEECGERSIGCTLRTSGLVFSGMPQDRPGVLEGMLAIALRC
jgi:hypothetical protein